MFSLAELSQRLGTSFTGDPDTVIKGVKSFDQAGPEDLTLATDRTFLRRIDSCAAAVVIVPEGVSASDRPLLISSHPKLDFARALALVYGRPFEAKGVSEHVQIGSGCEISASVTIEPFVRIGDQVVIGDRVTIESGARLGSGVRIGDDSRIHANVILYRDTIVGHRTTIHSGTVIGADGFGYVWDGQRHFKMMQLGRVEIGNDVEIGANCSIDRAAAGSTTIEDDVKIDNLVHIGHNCHIGRSTIIVGCVGISGSVKVGSGCVIAGQTGFVDHVRVGDNVTIMGDTVVTRDVPSNSTISGRFGRAHGEEMRIEAIKRKLPEMYREMRRLRAELESLKSARGVEADE